MKQILLYTPIFNFTAEAFVEKLNQIDKKEDVEVLMNTPGGSVFAGWSIIASLQERKGKVSAKVYGDCSSMGTYMLCYIDNVTALDVAKFTLHRADGIVENEDDISKLNSINKDLRAALEAKIDAKKFEEKTNVSIETLFNSREVINVTINAETAKYIGLIKDVIRLNKAEQKAMVENFVAFADFSEQGSNEKVQGGTQQAQNSNNNQIVSKMTKQEFKAQNPELYAEIVAEGKAEGIKAEATRTKGFLAYLDIDKTNVIASIKDGKEFDLAVMAEMNTKMTAAAQVAAITGDSTQAITTQKATDKTAEQKEIEAFQKEVTEGAKKIKIY